MLRNLIRANLVNGVTKQYQRNVSTTLRLNEIFKVQVSKYDFTVNGRFAMSNNLGFIGRERL